MSDKGITLFLDESGDHSLQKIDPQYPVFVLGGLIVNNEDLLSIIEPEIKEFKKSFFGREDIILHTADICRNKNGFEQMKEAYFRNHFLKELNALMARLPYIVVACVIKKNELLQRYQENAKNPYEYALHVLVERFVMEARSRTTHGEIIAESRDHAENKHLLEEWDRVCSMGTSYVRGEEVSQRVKGFSLIEKSKNTIGLQLADLIVSPIGRKIIKKKAREDWEIISGKFRRGEKGVKGYGLIILP
ncbi:MAG TPA: DUF3800 domain-containing protein [Spirochaetales bacterium]|nr:DUF3800 domain-containing protein [Spirochaetales bacterium]